MNALRWAISPLLQSPKDGIADLFIVVEALRNTFDYLVSFSPEFIAGHIDSTELVGDEASVREFWLALGVDPCYMGILVELNLWFEDGKLRVLASWLGDPAVFEQVSRCLLYLFKLGLFCKSVVDDGPFC